MKVKKKMKTSEGLFSIINVLLWTVNLGIGYYWYLVPVFALPPVGISWIIGIAVISSIISFSIETDYILNRHIIESREADESQDLTHSVVYTRFVRLSLAAIIACVCKYVGGF